MSKPIGPFVEEMPYKAEAVLCNACPSAHAAILLELGDFSIQLPVDGAKEIADAIYAATMDVAEVPTRV